MFTELSNYILIGWEYVEPNDEFRAYLYKFKDVPKKSQICTSFELHTECVDKNLKCFEGNVKIGKYAAEKGGVLKCKHFLTSLLEKVKGSTIIGNQIEQFALLKPEIALQILQIATDLDFKPNENFKPVINEQTGETINKPKLLSWSVEIENSELQGQTDKLFLTLYYDYEFAFGENTYQEKITRTYLRDGRWHLDILKCKNISKNTKNVVSFS